MNWPHRGICHSRRWNQQSLGWSNYWNSEVPCDRKGCLDFRRNCSRKMLPCSPIFSVPLLVLPPTLPHVLLYSTKPMFYLLRILIFFIKCSTYIANLLYIVTLYWRFQYYDKLNFIALQLQRHKYRGQFCQCTTCKLQFALSLIETLIYSNISNTYIC